MARDGLFAQAEGLTGCATYHGPSGVRSGVVWCGVSHTATVDHTVVGNVWTEKYKNTRGKS